MKNKTPICTKCQIRYVLKPFKQYDENICWICFLKKHKQYKGAIKEIGGWFDWSTHMFSRIDCQDVKTGWSFAPQLIWSLVFVNILNHPGLNETCKMPEHTNGLRKDGWPAPISAYDSLILLGASPWRAKIALQSYKRRK